MKKRKLRIQFAFDLKGTPTTPLMAVKGSAYFCPECNERVIFRKNQINRPHFAHKQRTHCIGESIAHLSGKRSVMLAFDRWWTGIAPEPVIQTVCKDCGKTVVLQFAQSINKYIKEYEVPSGFKADIALFENEVLMLAVEVRHTHKVPEGKASLYGVDFVEIEAEDIVECNHIWKPINTAWTERQCDQCKEQIRLAEENRRKDQEYRRLEEDRERQALQNIKKDIASGKCEERNGFFIITTDDGYEWEIDDWWMNKLVEEFTGQAHYLAHYNNLSLLENQTRYMIGPCCHCGRETLLLKWPGQLDWKLANRCIWCKKLQQNSMVKWPVLSMGNMENEFRKDIERLTIEHFRITPI